MIVNPGRQDVSNVVKAYTTRKKKTNITCHSSLHKDNVWPWCESLFKTTLPDHEEILEKSTLKTLLQSSWSGTLEFVMDLRLGSLLTWKVFAMQEPVFNPQHPCEKAVWGSHPSQFCRGGERMVPGSCCLAQIPDRDFAPKTTATTTTKTVRWTVTEDQYQCWPLTFTQLHIHVHIQTSHIHRNALPKTWNPKKDWGAD